MPGRIKKKKERERERVSRELHDSYDSERKPRKEDKRWKREGDYEERKPKDAQSTLEREREKLLVQASDGTEKKTLI